MREVLINAGFGEPISEEDRAWIRAHRFHGARSDYGPGVLGALYYTPFRPLIIAAGQGRTHEYIVDRVAAICREARDIGYCKRQAPVPAIEPINEPDLDPYWQDRPTQLADVVWECYQIVRHYSSSIPLISPGISNLNKRGLTYLERMMAGRVPDDVVIGFHRYPAGKDPMTPHSGFKTRIAEYNRLQALAGQHRLWCTETGWTTGPEKKARAFPLCFLHKNVYLTEETIAKNLANELRFWARTTVDSVTLYQINDGPNREDTEDNFGLRTYPEKRDKVAATWMPELIMEVTGEC